ncbi:MAG: type II secretion system protein [Armatimonadota bacterium]
MRYITSRMVTARSGFTLVETLTAMSIFTMLTFGGLSLVVASVNAYSRDFSRVSMETDIGQAFRRLDDGLREACAVTVDANGQGLTYYYPVKYTGADGKLHYRLPITSDGVARRLYKSENRLVWTDNSRPLAKNLTTGSARLFTLQSSGKAVLITLSVTSTTGKETFTNAKSYVVRLRNAL